jgi:hypothetical protein
VSASKDETRISPGEAGAMLADVESVVARVKRSRVYQTTSTILMFWGVVVAVGNGAAYETGRWAGYSWLALDTLGVIATALMLRRSRRGSRFEWRLIVAAALFLGFGLVWSLALGRMAARELDAFWPTLFLFGYALAGLWFGRAFTLIGAGIAALIIAGYFWAGAWFGLYLALVNGGGLILCGYGMRRA